MNYGNLILKYPDITTVHRLINTIWDINQSYHDVFKWQWLNKFDYFLRRKKHIFLQTTILVILLKSFTWFFLFYCIKISIIKHISLYILGFI